MIELFFELLEGFFVVMIVELGCYWYQVFIEKLGWDVVFIFRVCDQEFDQFDYL